MTRFRWAPALLLAAGTSAALGLLLPLAPDPGLRGLVLALPWVAAGLSIVRGRLGARRAGPGWWLAATGWALAAAGEHRLGLGPGATALAAAAYFVGVAAAALRLLPALRRALGRDGRGRIGGTIVLLAATIGLAFLPWTHATAEPNGDEPYYLLLADSLAHDGDVDLRNQYEQRLAEHFTSVPVAPQPGDPVGPHGERYSRHQPLLPALLVPFWLAGGAFGTRLAMIVLWALASERMLALLLAAGVTPRGALRAWLAATFAPPMLLYAGAIWVEVPAALLVATALAAWERRTPRERGSRHRLAVAVAALALLPLLKLRLAVVALPMALAMLIADRERARSRRMAAIAIAAILVALALVIGSNLATAGSALGVHREEELRIWEHSPQHFGLAIEGLVLDPAFGLIAGPVWLLALTGFGRALRSRRTTRFAMIAALPYLLVVASRREWYGGWSPPLRYVIVLVPLLVLPLGFAFDRPPTSRERTLRAGLTVVTALIGLAFLVQPGWATSLADGRAHLADVVGRPFAADLSRFLPSAVRPRLADGIAPLVLAAVFALALFGTPRGRRRVWSRAAVWLLALWALWIVAAHRVPTRWVELEDPWLVHRGGTLYPARWTVDRTRFAGGWILVPGASIDLRPVRRGNRATASLRARLGDAAAPNERVVLRCGRSVVADWTVRSKRWTQLANREITSCPEGVYRLELADPAPARGRWVVVDRLGFESR